MLRCRRRELVSPAGAVSEGAAVPGWRERVCVCVGGCRCRRLEAKSEGASRCSRPEERREREVAGLIERNDKY